MQRLKWCTPYEALNGTAPDISHLQISGCAAYVYIPADMHKNKLAPKSELMAYLGAVEGIKGHCFMCLANNQIYTAATALFDESLFPKCKDSRTCPITRVQEPIDAQPLSDRPHTTPGDDDDPPKSGTHHKSSTKKKHEPPVPLPKVRTGFKPTLTQPQPVPPSVKETPVLIEHEEFHDVPNQPAAEDDDEDGEDDNKSSESSESEESDNFKDDDEESTSEGDKGELHAPPVRTPIPPPPLPQRSPLRRSERLRKILTRPENVYGESRHPTDIQKDIQSEGSWKKLLEFEQGSCHQQIPGGLEPPTPTTPQPPTGTSHSSDDEVEQSPSTERGSRIPDLSACQGSSTRSVVTRCL